MSSAAPGSEQLRLVLEAAGWRCTRQRQAVYDYLVQTGSHHPTAEEIYRCVRGEVPRISLATVYKALEALEACGLVTRLAAHGDGSARFDARAEGHYHLRCLRTGHVEDLPTPFDPELIAKLDPDLSNRLQQKGFRVTGYRLELVGFYEDSEATAPPDDEEPTDAEGDGS